jgi:diphosphomevalonate decarboxylase
VVSRNDIPTASGLASSASGFAALALAASRAAGLELDARELSTFARRGSGSAARSFFGGFVRMHAGNRADGGDAFATPIESSLADRVRMVIAIVGGGAPKTHGSRDAMDHTAATSPFYASWIALVPRDLEAAEAAIARGDVQALGEIAEANALAMHASAIAARPAVIYWQPASLAALAAVRDLRAKGHAAWATMDAGPHVKVLTTTDDAAAVARALAAVPGVTETMISTAGGPAQVIAEARR